MFGQKVSKAAVFWPECCFMVKLWSTLWLGGSMNSNYLKILCLPVLLSTFQACEGETFVRQDPSKLLVNTDLIDFGPVAAGGNVMRSLTFTTHGFQSVAVTALEVTPIDAPFSAEETMLTVAGNSDQRVNLFFSPVNAGSFEAVMAVTSDAVNTTDTSVTLKGVAYDEFICGECDNPPDNYCINATSRLVYNYVGECVNGQCQYQGEIEECEYGCHEPTGMCNGAPTECNQNSDCDDGVFCNGAEVCNENECEPGASPCSGDLAFCDEDNDVCVACIENIHCSDGLFCNGEEICTDGMCSSGTTPCYGATPLCDEDTDTCSGCSEADPCSEQCIAQCSGHCSCLAAGNNLVSVAFDLPSSMDLATLLLAEDRFNHIIGGRVKAVRDNDDSWVGELVAGTLGPKDSFWVSPSTQMLWSMPGTPNFNHEYTVTVQVAGLLNDCSQAGETCAGMICQGDNDYSWDCDDQTNWISFPGLARQRVFDTDDEVGAIPPEVQSKLKSIITGGLGTFKQDDGTWIGSLTYFEPMGGYQVVTEEDVTFKFNIDMSLPENATVSE